MRTALLLFHDDASLAVARAFARLIEQAGLRPSLALFVRQPSAPPALSARQLEQGLDGRPLAGAFLGAAACDEARLARYDMVAAANLPPHWRRLWLTGGWRFAGRRPCFVALFPGLELTGGRGYWIRRFADVVCTPTEADRLAYLAMSLPDRPAHQAVLRFHPRLLRAHPAAGGGRRVVFFAQSVSPPTLEGRRHVAHILAAAARANPDVQVVVKLRHTADENRTHTHIERHGYEELVAEIGRPDNLVFSTETAEAALAAAGLAITCTSTAGIEAVAQGTPTLFLLDFADAEIDPLVTAMRGLLAGSGLIAGPQDVLALRQRALAPGWAAGILSEGEDFAALMRVCAELCAAQPPLRRSWKGSVERLRIGLDAVVARRLGLIRRDERP